MHTKLTIQEAQYNEELQILSTKIKTNIELRSIYKENWPAFIDRFYTNKDIISELFKISRTCKK
jgi:hypothetical protein